MSTLIAFTSGVLAALAATASLFFLRFWRTTKDRFFVLFAGAFAALALCWTVLALTDPLAESRPYVYVLRLVGFVLILGAIALKNAGSGKKRDDAEH